MLSIFSSSRQPTGEKFYDLPSVNSNRSASFGFGSKLDISRLANNSPPPNSYTIEGDFERKRPNSIAIGLGRDVSRVKYS